ALLDDDPADAEIVAAVLRLVPHAAPDALPDWLGLLELPDETGATRPADELLLPGAPLGEVLVADSPFGVVADETVRTHGAEALRAVGVGWNFGIVTETDPTGPDHHLDDEERWWAGLESDPENFAAVRDLDLVDDDAWPRALRLLLTDPRTAELFGDPRGYTPWWLREHARTPESRSVTTVSPVTPNSPVCSRNSPSAISAPTGCACCAPCSRTPPRSTPAWRTPCSTPWPTRTAHPRPPWSRAPTAGSPPPSPRAPSTWTISTCPTGCGRCPARPWTRGRRWCSTCPGSAWPSPDRKSTR